MGFTAGPDSEPSPGQRAARKEEMQMFGRVRREETVNRLSGVRPDVPRLAGVAVMLASFIAGLIAAPALAEDEPKAREIMTLVDERDDGLGLHLGHPVGSFS